MRTPWPTGNAAPNKKKIRHNSYLASFVPNVPRDFNNIKQDKNACKVLIKECEGKTSKIEVYIRDNF